MRTLSAILISLTLLTVCDGRYNAFKGIPEFSDATNAALEKFFRETRDEKGEGNACLAQ